MKIWIDGFEANILQRLGSSQVAFELIKKIEKIDKKNEYTILLASEPLADMPKARDGFTYKILKPNRLKTFLAIPWAVFRSKEKPDLIFSPTHYIPRFTSIKRICMIFDLSFLHFPEMFNKKDLYQLSQWTKYSVKNASHLITISKTTKQDIVKQYKVSKDNITVAYPGFDENVFRPIIDLEGVRKVLEKYEIDGEYVLFIGTLQPRKNLIRLIEAVSRIDNLKLVIAGKSSEMGRQGWKYEEILQAPAKIGVENRVIFTGFAETSDLPYLINGAVAFCLPSLWEGFGIPVVEAMACGIPVLVSNVSSLPEVVGNAGLTFDPYRVDQIEQAIRIIYADRKQRDRLSKLSIVRSAKFSWKNMAKEVIKVFENV